VHEHAIALGDRIACAGLSSMLMAVALAVGAVIIAVLMVLTGMSDPSLGRMPATHFGFVYFLDGFLLWLITVACFSVAVLGFVLGPDRMLRVWAVIGQTETPTRAELVIAVCVLCGIFIAMVTYVLHRLDVLQL